MLPGRMCWQGAMQLSAKRTRDKMQAVAQNKKDKSFYTPYVEEAEAAIESDVTAANAAKRMSAKPGAKAKAKAATKKLQAKA